MRLVIVPDDLGKQIHDAIDRALCGRECSECDRKILYVQLLRFYDEHGRIPEFNLRPTEPFDLTEPPNHAS